MARPSLRTPDEEDRAELLAGTRTKSNKKLLTSTTFHTSVPKLLAQGFKPSHLDFEEAEAAGTLQALMGVLHFDLRRFPDVAELTWEAAVRFIRARKQEDENSEYVTSERKERLRLVKTKEELNTAMSEHANAKGVIHPTPEASMLANYLEAPGETPENLMNALAEEVTIFDRIGTDLVVGQRDLPESLGPVYLKKQIASTEIAFDHEFLMVKFTETDKTKEDALKKELRSLIGNREHNLAERHQLCSQYGYHATSMLWDSTLHATEFKHGAESVTKFAFVLPSQSSQPKLQSGKGINIDNGGLLLFGQDPLKLLAYMSLEYVETTTKACAFGPGRALTQEQAKELKQIAFEMQNLPKLQEVGITRCAWIGPGTKLARDNNEKHGGLAMLFEDPMQSRFYPLSCITRVVSRGVLSQVGNKPEMRVQMMHPAENGKAIQEALSRAGRVMGATSPQSEQPVRFLRVAIPGILHPLVLHSLLHSPQDEVMQTLTAKAIACAGYDLASKFVIANIVAQSLVLASLTYFARTCRRARSDPDYRDAWSHGLQGSSHPTTTGAPEGIVSDIVAEDLLDGPLQQYFDLAAYATIFVVSVLSLYVLHLQLVGLKRYRLLTPQTVLSYSRIEQVFALILDIPLLVTMLPHALMWLLPGSVLKFVKYARAGDQLGVVLALRGALVCFHLLILFTGVESLGIGKRILPISKTVGATYSFLFIMLFFLGASFIVSYSMTNDLMSTITFNTYRMAFVGDYPRTAFFNVEDDEDGTHWDDHGIAWVARFVTYCAFGILIMVTLNNIFIGIVGNTYDHFQERASMIFVRTRARIALDYLCMCKVDNIEHLWICTDPASKVGTSGFSLRTCIQDLVGKKLETLLEEVDHTAHRMDSLEHRMGQNSRQNMEMLKKIEGLLIQGPGVRTSS